MSQKVDLFGVFVSTHRTGIPNVNKSCLELLPGVIWGQRRREGGHFSEQESSLTNRNLLPISLPSALLEQRGGGGVSAAL